MNRTRFVFCAILVIAVSTGWAGSEREPVNPFEVSVSEPAPLTSFDWPAPDAVLWDNGPLVTCPGCGSGGADVSEVQSALSMTIYGFGHQVSADNWIADDFSVGDAAGWNVDSITFFAYQTNAGVPSTITNVNWILFDGDPSAGGTPIASGSGLNATDWTNIYRTLDTDLGNTARAIMWDEVDMFGMFLPQGDYWIAWQTDGSASFSGPWAPPVTVLGSTGTGNALQSTDAGVTWNPATDVGPQDFPFVIQGSVAGSQEVLACNGPAVAFENGIPTSFTVVVNTGPVYWSTTDDLDACDNGGNQTLGSGEAACADSDETNPGGDPYDTELWSGSFDLSGGFNSASLRFAAAYNDITSPGADSFQVWVWDGASWTQELVWDEDHNEVVILDLAPYLGQPDAAVSFRYSGDSWDWWAQVDDVSLGCCDLFCDGFESGDTSAWSGTVP